MPRRCDSRCPSIRTGRARRLFCPGCAGAERCPFPTVRGVSHGRRVRHLRQAPRFRPQRAVVEEEDQSSVEPEHPARTRRGERHPEASQRVHRLPEVRQGHPLTRNTQESPPKPAGSPGCFGSAGDLAGLQAAGAHVETLRGAVHHGAYALDVRAPLTIGLLLRPRHVVAETGALGADVAHGGHGTLLELWERGTVRRPRNLDRITYALGRCESTGTATHTDAASI